MKRLIFVNLQMATPYIIEHNLNDVIEKLPYDPKIVSKWFKDNRMMAKPGIF